MGLHSHCLFCCVVLPQGCYPTLIYCKRKHFKYRSCFPEQGKGFKRSVFAGLGSLCRGQLLQGLTGELVVLKQSYSIILPLQGLGGRQGEGENDLGLWAGLRVLHSSCVVVTLTLTLLPCCVISVRETAVGLLKLGRAAE